MASVYSIPQTISGKVKTRTPTQAQALSSRYTFLNLQNAEPNLGAPGTTTGTSPESYEGHTGLRYALLSNNTQNGLSAWRVWSFDNPRVAFYSVENSLAIGENANPIRVNSIVYNNHPYGTNRYNSESLAENSFNVYALSGIYLFDSTTVGDPASAITFVVTESGCVGINTDSPIEALSIVGSISASGFLSAGNVDANFHKFIGSLTEGSEDNFVHPFSISHAEGDNTGSVGNASHAEGGNTSAVGNNSHAEGYNSTTGEKIYYSSYDPLTRIFTFSPTTSASLNGVFSGQILRGASSGFFKGYPAFTITVEDRDTLTGAITATVDVGADIVNGYLVVPFNGLYAHAEGAFTDAIGQSSHAEGDTTRAVGAFSHSEGSNTEASGIYSHSEGNSTEAQGGASHAEGIFSVAFGEGSHAGGNATLAAGDFSLARGDQTMALGWASHAIGHSSVAAQDFTFMWSDGELGTVTQLISTTRTGQFAVSASGGVFIPGNVGIGTDNNDNALTVSGLISAGSIDLSNANVTNLISATASGDFLTLNINGVNRAIRIWDF